MAPLALVLSVLSVLPAADDTPLEAAAAHAAAGHHEQALAELAGITPSQADVPTRAELARLKGTSLALLGRSGDAEVAFIALLVLLPDYRAAADDDARVARAVERARQSLLTHVPRLVDVAEEEGPENTRLVRVTLRDPYEQVGAVVVSIHPSDSELSRLWRFRFLNGHQTFIGSMPSSSFPQQLGLQFKSLSGLDVPVERGSHVWNSPMQGSDPALARPAPTLVAASTQSLHQEALDAPLPLFARVLLLGGLATGSLGGLALVVAVLPTLLGLGSWLMHWAVILLRANAGPAAQEILPAQSEALLGSATFGLLFVGVGVACLGLALAATGAAAVGLGSLAAQ
jgi:hypothetical protein